jgi:Sulfotransferase domain
VHWRKLLSATRIQLGTAVKSYAAREFLPARRCDDDLFLVEFPKSGVTWLTFLIANVHALLNEDRRAVTFFNINDFVPDVQVTRHVDSAPLRFPGYRCFKSHAPYLPQYRKVFYLVRDPRHVLVSYWHFLQTLGAWRGTLAEFLEHPEYGIEAWVKHVRGWLDGVDAAASFTMIRYEDLVANPAAELTRLYELLGLPVNEGLIGQAVERSSIERMRKSEAVFSAGHPALKNMEFVRRGETGGSRRPLPDEQRRRIETVAAELMQRLGYPPLEAR